MAHPDVPGSWPGKKTMGTKLVGTLQLENGEMVYVVYSMIENPTFENKSINANFFKGRSQADIEDGKLRMLVFGSHHDGSKTLYDYPVYVKTGN